MAKLIGSPIVKELKYSLGAFGKQTPHGYTPLSSIMEGVDTMGWRAGGV
jgi:hypothetical protein